MEQKIAFIARARALPRGQFAHLCREFYISRKTGYKWLRRYRSAGSFTGLAEQSRRPRHSPKRVEQSLVDRIVELRAVDGWGARKIAHILWEQGVSVSVATVHRTLLRETKIHKLSRHTPALERFERPVPNNLFQADFKGPMGQAGARDEPLTVLDDHSRFALGVFALRNHQTAGVQACFVRVFERYGLPRQLLLDHGTPWWNSNHGWGLSQLAVFFLQQNIELIFSRIGHPQTQGKIERFHRTLARSMVHQGLPTAWEQWQERYDGFLQRYNQERPHEALGMQRPAERYRSSPRTYRPQPADWIYPPGLRVCPVDSTGSVYVERHRYFVCGALAHQRVALEKIGGHILVRFRHMYIRELDLVKRTTLAFVYPINQISA